MLTLDDPRLLHDAQLAGDVVNGFSLVATHDDNPDTGAVAGRHCRSHLRAGRVDHCHQGGEDQLLLRGFRGVRHAIGQCQHPQSLGGVAIGLLLQSVAFIVAKLPRCSLAVYLAAAIDKHIGRALHRHVQRAIGGAVGGAHVFQFGIERTTGHRLKALANLPVAPLAINKLRQRQFGGVAVKAVVLAICHCQWR